MPLDLPCLYASAGLYVQSIQAASRHKLPLRADPPRASKDDDLVLLIHASQAVMDTAEHEKGEEHAEQWRGKKVGPGVRFRPSGVPVVA